MNELQQTYMIISTWTVIRTIMQTQKKTEWGLYVPCKTGALFPFPHHSHGLDTVCY
uniref:Uncharacterized protein n=1 Tax=Setaria italica TaxID=4555 RepID=K4AHW6_SETIT